MVSSRITLAWFFGLEDSKSVPHETSVTLDKLLLPLDRLLRKKRVGYAVIGSYAVAAWGAIRATRDLDLLCEVEDVGHDEAN